MKMKQNSHTMEQVAYDVYGDPYEEYDEDTGNNEKSDGHYDRDDNKDPE